MAQKRLGISFVTSAPMASSTGRASRAPPVPFRKARRSSFRLIRSLRSLLILLLLLFEKHLTGGHEPDHVAHPIAIGFQFRFVVTQNALFVVSQGTARSVSRQMAEHAIGYLIDAVFGEVTLQIVRARDFGLIGQGGMGVGRFGLESAAGIVFLHSDAPGI